MTTGIIILNYNNSRDTLVCIESLLALRKVQSEVFIVIVDNCSEEKDYDTLFNRGSELRKSAFLPLDYFEERISSAFQSDGYVFLLKSKFNSGYAAGNNLGIRFCQDFLKCDYFWILNNDTKVHPAALDELIHKSRFNDDFALVGSTLFDYENTSEPQAFNSRYNKLYGVTKDFVNKDIDVLPNDNFLFTNYIVGASFLFSKKILGTIGYLPEDYFLYYEDVDYCLSAKKKNVKLVVANLSVVFHKRGGTTNDGKKTKSAMTDYFYLRNKILFTKKHFKVYLFFIYLSLGLTFLKRIITGQSFSIKMFFKAIQDA